MKLPIYVKNCIELLENAGFSAYAVGGAVRDGLLGVEPSDWDVTTSARPEEILRVFENYRTIPTGIQHGTVTVLFESDGKNIPVEVTTFRIDGEYKDSRHPESVNFSKDVRDDLSRRDFTVNAMAYNENDGLIDVFGGMNDLENRIIRAVGNPQKRFSEDALRILRAFRFSAQMGFEIENETLKGAISCSHLLKNIARERIGIEFKKLISSKGVIYSLAKMIEGGVWGDVFCIDSPSISRMKSLSLLTSDNYLVRLSILISDCSEEEQTEFLDSLRFSNAERKTVLRLISINKFEASGKNIGAVARRFLHLFGDIYDLSFPILQFYYSDKTELLMEIESENKKKRPLSVSSLAVNGSDLLTMCASNHKRVGLILNRLLYLVIENPELNEKEQLLQIAMKLNKNEDF